MKYFNVFLANEIFQKYRHKWNISFEIFHCNITKLSTADCGLKLRPLFYGSLWEKIWQIGNPRRLERSSDCDCDTERGRSQNRYWAYITNIISQTSQDEVFGTIIGEQDGVGDKRATITIAWTLGCTTFPPADLAYAVEPVEVETRTP